MGPRPVSSWLKVFTSSCSCHVLPQGFGVVWCLCALWEWLSPNFHPFLDSWIRTLPMNIKLVKHERNKKRQQRIPEKECSALLTCSSSAKYKVWSEYFKAEFNTNTMKWSPTSEPNSLSASQEISQILFNLQVHYCIHKSPSLLCILSHVNPFHPHRIPVLFSAVSWVQHASPILSFWIWWGVQIIRLFIMSFWVWIFSSAPYYQTPSDHVICLMWETKFHIRA